MTTEGNNAQADVRQELRLPAIFIPAVLFSSAKNPRHIDVSLSFAFIAVNEMPHRTISFVDDVKRVFFFFFL